MNFIGGIFAILFRSISWALSRIIVAIIQQWIIVATLLLINGGSFKAKKAWAITRGSPANLKALMRKRAIVRKNKRRVKKLERLERKLVRSKESLEIIAET